MKPYIIESQIMKTPLSHIRLGGYVGKLMDTFFEERIFSDYAQNVVYRECEDGFINRIDDIRIPGIGFWQGEFWGKWIISAVRAAKYTGSASMKEFIHAGALKLVSLQQPDGYLGTYRNSADFMAPTPEAAAAAKHPRWNWNIWCRKYTLWGMLEAYELTGDETLLTSCVRMADHLIRRLDEQGRHIGETGTFEGMPSCSIMKPVLILYRITEDKRYLDFCLSIADRWEDASVMPGLIANALNGKALSEWYPDSNLWAKAYEMMSCYDGLIELYRVTGTEKYLRASEMFFDILMEHEWNALFSVAYNDVFGDAAYDVSCITEPCDIIHLIRLCHELYTLTGKSKYMDAAEEAFCNPFLAAAFSDGKWGARGVRGNGRHLVAIQQAGFTKNHCCVNNMPRGFLNIAESAVMHDSKAVIINFYTEADAEITAGGGLIRVEIRGDYLADSRAQIRVDFGESALRAVRFRIPAWSAWAKLTADGREYKPEAGYFTVTASGSRLEAEIELDNSVHVYPVKADPRRGEREWKRGRFLNAGAPMGCVDEDVYCTAPQCLIRKGVMLLCRSKLIGNTEKEMFGGIRMTENAVCTAERIRETDEVNLAYILHVTDGEEKYDLRVCDFASGTNRMFEDTRSFSIYF